MSSIDSRLYHMSPLKLAFAARRARAAARLAHMEPIAVVGTGCRFPGGAVTPDLFWDLLIRKQDAVTEVPPERWRLDSWYDPDTASPGKISCRYGAFLPSIDMFDPAFFNITPREAAEMDPQQRLLLEVTFEALLPAGYTGAASTGNRPVGVFTGISTFDYAALKYRDRPPGNIDAYFNSGNVLSVAAGRISYTLGLTGPCMSVDTACSSSLVAVHLACESLRREECRAAVAGGVGLILTPEPSVGFTKANMLSPTGRCRAFDHSADGYVRGEGCGMVVMKRLTDAIADEDMIYAVIRGSAVNQDGAAGGLTVPCGPAQETVIRKALGDGGVLPEQVGYVETHGTGTPLGDSIEACALGEVFGGRDSSHPLMIGSVKTNIGHLEAASGIAGMLKVILSMQHESIPAQLHFSKAGPKIDLEKYSMKVASENCRWQPVNGRRIAGVSSFGFCGTNAHVVLESFEDRRNIRKRKHTVNPVYKRQSYWFGTGGTDDLRKGNPLTGRRISLPMSKEIRFENILSSEIPVIREHRLFDVYVLAAACQIAMALEAVRSLCGSAACEIRHMNMNRPLIIDPCKERRIQLIFGNHPDKQSEFSIVGMDGDAGYEIHTTAEINGCCGPLTGLPELPLEPGLPMRISGGELYDRLEKNGHTAWNEYRCIKQIRYNNTEAVTDLQVAAENTMHYSLHPAIIDACFYFLCMVAPGRASGENITDGNAVFVPFSVDHICILKAEKGRNYQCVTKITECNMDTFGIIANICLYGENGELLMLMHGVRARQVSRLYLTENQASLAKVSAVKENTAPDALMGNLSSSEIRSYVIQHIRMEISEITGIKDPDKIDARRGLFDIGLDSVMAVELRNRLEYSMKISLPVTIIFEYPTLEMLADYILKIRNSSP